MKIGVVDIETSGFINAGGKILEIGIASLDIDTGEIKEHFHSLCKEEGMTDKDRDAWIFSNSDLTVEEIREAPFLNDIREEVQKALSDFEYITAYNKSFDFDFLRSRNFIIGKELDCPMIKSTPVCKIANKNGRSGYKWPKVEEAWAFFFPDKPYVEAHRGLDDAMHEAEIVKELVSRGVIGIPDEQ